MKAEYLSKIIAELIELIDEGVYIVDQDGVGRFYNKAMASMEKVNIEDVLGKKFHEAFPDFSLNDSTMFEALKKNNATLRKQQTYKNLYGKEITTINSTIPIIADGQTVAAVEVAKDITNIRKMSDTLLELTESKHEPADPTAASLILSLESAFAAISGALVLHESMTLRQLLGCAVIFCAVILSNLPEKQAKLPNEPK